MEVARCGKPDREVEELRAPGVEAAVTGANRECGSRAEGGPDTETTREDAKEQAGSFDPGMEAAERRQPLRASEKPFRADRFRAEESTRRAIEALIRVPGNPGFGE